MAKKVKLKKKRPVKMDWFEQWIHDFQVETRKNRLPHRFMSDDELYKVILKYDHNHRDYDKSIVDYLESDVKQHCIEKDQLAVVNEIEFIISKFKTEEEILTWANEVKVEKEKLLWQY